MGHHVTSHICETGIVAVIRAENGEQAARITDACVSGGITAIELTFTVPRAHQTIEQLALLYGDKMVKLGAGTVMDAETARIAILSGAQYIVSPYLNKDIAELCHRYGVPYFPGAMTIKEIVEAMEAGAEMVKLFPGEVFGPAFINAVKGPIPHVKIMPTGGVTIENVTTWFKAGASAVGVGSSLTKGAESGDYVSITRMAIQFVDKIREARVQT
ncbi:bifunctional 4-hydroxy-2-oxoglutarate aldolase/2-dehydro-3-deoxy-phosphogluconate aldolase [Brevibacillus sp. SYP-B805]|uniref:bifunctional 2-keto-4-hydroxyglutarate aldolase/2-keto-3-deoxy-6-phosphogluconate aldolase n=1 Tax=Brevibacillus sp. SYP-B805 TaxID=1578199 RepID=UPI0013EE3532|nr:bifunctional 2-keto-4-hydroxyglutarate aldolase/2-keto-3-deoxy-6-phosphogluconate aldolase [Brevibacillus sp. SYP-B805]NGQ95765.1 bifunctional 4-hydroxy-2-oxoglutarate aldolase/2-dehydro-3-deoxy-phosphogluconate aldolase [Brevibacillus sp. SYP-B805]